MRNQFKRKFTVWLAVIVFALTVVSPAFSGSRIMPAGKVKVFEGPKLMQILKHEAPLPSGALLSTEGKCAVRLENLYLVAEDGCTFCVVDGSYNKVIRVDKGMVYFSITSQTCKLIFLTPAGEISTQQFRLNVATGTVMLNGYLDVSTLKVQLGVLEGGSMVVSTAQGDKEILTGKQILLALADHVNKKGKNEEELAKAVAGDQVPASYFVTGATLLGATAVGIYNNSNGSSNGSSATPSEDDTMSDRQVYIPPNR